MDEVVQYDWDSTKNKINEAKHGISFYDALILFFDPQGYIEEVTRIEHGERRFKAIGRVDDLLSPPSLRIEATYGGSSLSGGHGKMSDENTVRVRKNDEGIFVQVMPDGSTRSITGDTDWERLRNMTEEEIEANALSDPDNPPISDEELKRFRRVPNLQHIRTDLNLTQEEFSEKFQIPLGTLRDWEQGKKWPDSAARVLLRVIEKEPEAVIRALAS